MATREPWYGLVVASPRDPRPDWLDDDVGGAVVHFICMATDAKAYRVTAAQYMREEGWRLDEVDDVEPVQTFLATADPAPEIMDAIGEVRRTGRPVAADKWFLFPAEDEQ